jgi:uncharacterized damage-inducible protein DinB
MSGVDELVYLLNEAFEGKGIEETNESQSLMQNLASVDEAKWRALPAGGVRTIESIAVHVGSCKLMYDEYAFGPGRLQWGTPEVEPWAAGEAPMPEVLEWLRELHGRFVEHVAALEDSDLAAPRLANWGEKRETRWLISVILQHDTYHAGEINHTRALLAADDRWRW